MKKYQIICALLGMSQLALAQVDPEQEAIKKFLEKEGVAYRMGNQKVLKESWAKRPSNFNLISMSDGRVIDVDPTNVGKSNPNAEPSGGFSVHSNFQFNIHGNAAWVKHDEVSITKTGIRNHSKEIRTLEKEDGQWKLVGQSIHSYIPANAKKDTVSYIHTVDIESGDIQVLTSLNAHFEAPNWHPDNYLIMNSKGRMYTMDLSTKQPVLLNTGSATRNNNDHGISPDKKWLVVSNYDTSFPSTKSQKSQIFLLPISGGEPKKITNDVPSYWHGWTPDGKTLAYCAERNGNYDIYTIPVNGGKEKRITSTEGLDDGPDYSPDGKYIYFNSYRTGHMQIWRMLADGSNPEQLTFDDNSNWFAHPSPDNKWIVYISYMSDEKQQHLFGKQVKLRLMNLATKEIKDLTPVFFGGQGTINVPSWSPDSKKIAFVSYSIQ